MHVVSIVNLYQGNLMFNRGNNILEDTDFMKRNPIHGLNDLFHFM